MHYNILGYWRHLQNLPDGHEDKPGPRVCRLMLDMFEKWQTKQAFPDWDCFGHIRDHADEDDPPDLMTESLSVRRGVVLRKTLKQLVGPWGRQHGFSAVHPDELIVGTMPPYSVGQGKELMGYLKNETEGHDEELEFEIKYLNGWSNFGHIAPNHERVVQRGLRSLMDDCEARLVNATDDEHGFYRSVLLACEGVIRYAEGFADLAEAQAKAHEQLLKRHPDHPTRELFQERIEGMRTVSERLRRVPAEPCVSFTDAVQCIFIMNCSLHWTGELTSLGRLDQILFPYYEQDRLSFEQAQEVIDCLWVKLDERVMLDHRHFEDRFSSADGALLGSTGASNFDQGALANQWMQQVTLGGVKATDNPAKEEPAENEITRMCLEAARRFPFNCPTVDLRVNKKTPTDLLKLAAQAMLSGGAHPILMNDDKLIPALHKKSGGSVDLSSARNYACDGCYETLFPGETEFSFFYVPGVDALEKTLNSGADFGRAGATYLRGGKDSFRTPPAHVIENYDQFYAILEKHVRLKVNRELANLLRIYGCKGSVCPSPLLSAMVAGCLESGRDFYAGGARYHMFAPLMTGISTLADSLYVIENLVFQQKSFTLPELVSCLRSNWGQQSENVIGLKLPTERIKEIRERCLAEPKFGSGHSQVDKVAWKIINTFVKAVFAARQNPLHANAFERLKSSYDLPDRPFELLLTPGVGTFEQYLFGGGFSGATPDGRMAGDSLASDLSASPVPRNQEPILRAQTSENVGEYVRQYVLLDSLSSWNDSSVEKLSDGAPSDFNIREDFPLNELVKVLKEFAKGKGSNMMTVTVANPETLEAAEKNPEQFNLVRVRMGGWTEFFSVLFPGHKAHHRRRPVYLAKPGRRKA